MCRFAQYKTFIVTLLPHWAKRHMVTYLVLFAQMFVHWLRFRSSERTGRLVGLGRVKEWFKFTKASMFEIWKVNEWIYVNDTSVLETQSLSPRACIDPLNPSSALLRSRQLGSVPPLLGYQQCLRLGKLMNKFYVNDTSLIKLSCLRYNQTSAGP